MDLSPHFRLKELIPDGMETIDVPVEVLANLKSLCEEILEPLRVAMAAPIMIHSGYRPPDKNQAAGGVQASDHLSGNAADFNVSATVAGTWEENTFLAFAWIRYYLVGKYGQVIAEDHRIALKNPNKLWIHVSRPTEKHDGKPGDPNRVLVSFAPRHYEPWTEALEPLA